MDISTVTHWLSQIDIVRTAFASAGTIVGLVVVVWLWRRMRRPKIVSIGSDVEGCGICARLWGYMTRLLDAIDYLATRRAWRYDLPWVLVLGEQHSGKSSLVASLEKAIGHARPSRAGELKAKGMRWAFLQAGVMIDADGAFFAEAESGNHKRWKDSLQSLDELRPERPLDGLVLCVSARTLRKQKRSRRAETAAAINHQLGELQAGVEFVLPVYVVVTQCDDIPGFSAFWRNLHVDRQKEMFGYSATDQDRLAQPGEWAKSAFEHIGCRMREIQVDIAAVSKHLNDVDGFFLFPGHFRELRDPLTEWLEIVFRTTAWQSGNLFRGLYFSGVVDEKGAQGEGARNDVDFIEALAADKVLKERALARPTRQGVWSRNTLIRRVQFAAVAAGIGLFVALGFSARTVSKQLARIETSVKILNANAEVKERQQDDGDRCQSAEEVYPLLRIVSGIDTRSRYPAIPVSLLDGRRVTNESAQAIGKSTVQAILMPALSCHLRTRSQEVLASSLITPNTTRADYPSQREGFRKYVADVRELDDNLARYDRLAKTSGSLSERELMATLSRLSEYAFRAKLPRGVNRRGSVLDDAFRNIDIDKVPVPALPLDLRNRLIKAMDARSAYLRTALSREVASGDLLLESLDSGQQPVLENTWRLGRWLSWVQGSWLASTPAHNPCQAIVAENTSDITALSRRGDVGDILTRILRKFDEHQCYKPELASLSRMQMAPYGPLFLVGKKGLTLAPPLQAELSGMPALVVLPFMQLRTADRFQCMGSATNWRANEIAEAASYLDQYERFAKARRLDRKASADELDPTGGRPLYDRLARASLARAIDDALRRAQQAPDGAQDDLVAPTRSDAQIASVGNELSRGLVSLQRVLNAYADLGYADNGADVRQCARDFAADNLGGVDALADGSRLYSPPVPLSKDAMFAFGSLPVTKDFLARQHARAQVLGGYAEPFLTLLKTTSGIDDAWRDTPQTADFWSNTQLEIQRYTKGKEPSGQVANIDAYFINQLYGMTYGNCASVLAAYKSPELGNDLFSDRRRRLERQVQLRCSDQRQAEAESVYGELAKRFNRDLAGRYPFAAVNARDASPAVVRTFFLDYAQRREEIANALNQMDGARWRSASTFIANLDAAAEFFATNVAAPDKLTLIGVKADFPADTGRSVGADQLLWWRLRVDDMASQFPNAMQDLEWLPDESLIFDLRWAERSQWRPVPDQAQPQLGVRDLGASFTVDGSWALLRFIDMHRMPGAVGLGTNPIPLRFTVPIQSTQAAADGKPDRGDTVVFMTVRLTGTDPVAKTPKAIALPADFPRSAPIY